jgi:chitin synthase
MLEFAGMDLTNYFPPPMTIACPGLVTNDQLSLMRANFTPTVAYAIHTSGPLQTTNGTKLDNINWYEDRLMPDLVQYYKGAYVFARNDVASGAESDSK